MSEHFSYSKTYVLNRDIYSETYDQSVTLVEPQQAYAKAIVIAVVGLFLLYFTSVSGYVAWFVIALGGLEALGVRFQKAWWLARQMISKAANSELTLTINSEGIITKSHYVDSKMAWGDIQQLKKTELGWLVYVGGKKSYLSDKSLDESAQQFLREKAESIAL